jgi:hypothetical protein
MFSLKSSSYCENEAGKSLTNKILGLLNKDENAETIRQCYMEMINLEKGLPLGHYELVVFINEDDSKIVREKTSMDINFKTCIFEQRGNTDLHNLCSTISYLTSNTSCKNALKKVGKAGEWIKFEGIDRDIKKLVAEAGDCELKRILSANLQRGK